MTAIESICAAIGLPTRASQREIARAIGVSEATISAIATGKRTVTIGLVVAIARATGQSVAASVGPDGQITITTEPVGQ